MYGKIFESIYTGTLYGQWEAIVTFQQMIVLADEDGTVDYTPPALAAKTSIPLEIIEKGIASLMEPDKYSRSPDEDGRRIVLLDEDRPWGWRIVNYSHYRNVASREEKKRKDRERISEKRKKNKGVAGCRSKSHTVANVAHTDTDTNTDTKRNYNGAVAPPDYVSPEAWNGYLETRKKIKAPNTQRALTLLVNRIKQAHEEGYNVDALLDESTEKGWKSIYPKEKSNNGNDGVVF